MRVHITNLYGQARTSTAQKAQNLVAGIAKGLGYNELGIYSYSIKSDSPQMLSSRLDGIIASVSFGDTVIFQLPTWNDMRFDEELVRHLSRYRGLKKIFFIHDVPPLMSENGRSFLDRYIALYNQADLLILPSHNMYDFLRTEGLAEKKVVFQGMWDFPAEIDKSVVPRFRKAVSFAANVTQNDRPFVRNWNYDTVELDVTAGPMEWAKDKKIGFLGWFNDDNLLANALRKNGGFGLLWHDTPWWREYLKLNACYKLGAYLAAGIPVIVPSDIPEKASILRNNLGFAVSSIDEAVEIIENMDAERYNRMVERVDVFSDLIREGFFTKKVLTDAVFELLYD